MADSAVQTIGLDEAAGLRKLTLDAPSGLSKEAFKPVAIDVDVKGASVDVDYAREMSAIAETMQSKTGNGGNGLEVRDLVLDTGIVEIASLTDTGRLLQEAEAAVQRGQYGDALQLLDELLSLSPNQREEHEAHYLKALCQSHRAAFREALEELRLLGDVDLESALATRVEALRARVRSAMTPLVVISFMVASESDPEAARADLRAAIELDPENAVYHYTLGGSFAATADFHEALAVAERALAGDLDERDSLLGLRDQIRRRLLGDVLGEALDAFKQGSYRKASRELGKLPPEWREMEVVQDFDTYLGQLSSTGPSPRERPPEGPFERVDALYFVLAHPEVDAAKERMERGDTADAERIMERALEFVPRFPYLNFLYAGCLYSSVGEWFSDPGDTDLDRQLDRLRTASAAAAVAATDREIGAAPSLAEAIDGLRGFLDNLREAVALRAREAQAVNAAIEEYQSIMKDAEGGVRDEEHFNELRGRMRSLRISMPGPGDVHTDDAREMVQALGKAVKRNLDQLDSLESQVEGSDAAGKCFKTFESIMTSVKGGIESADQVSKVTSRMRKLRAEIDKAREQVRDRKVKKALKRLAKVVDKHLSELAQASDAVTVGDLIERFNAVAPKVGHADSLSSGDRSALGFELAAIHSMAGSRRSEAKSKQAKARLAELEAASDAAQKVLGRHMW